MMRSRIALGTLLLATIGMGLASRRFPSAQPAFVAAYAGDTLWAAAAYWGVALVWPRARVGVVAALALAVAYAVELSQLYRAPWLDALRATVPGALVLGQGFLWSDLACYAAGVGLASAIDATFLRGRDARAGARVPSEPPASPGH